MKTNQLFISFLPIPLFIVVGFVLSFTGCGRSNRSDTSENGHVTKDLAWSLEHGDLKDVESKLTSWNINGGFDGEIPALHIAARLGRRDVAEMLISKGAEINKTYGDFMGWTPLQYAASAGKVDMIEYLLQMGAKMDVVAKNGDYPIHTAARYGHIPAIKKLMDAGALPDQKSGIEWGDSQREQLDYETRRILNASYEYQPIHAAAQANQPHVIRFLVGLGISPNAKDIHGSNVLNYATSRTGWTQSRAETIRLVDKDGAFEKSATNIISTDGYYVTEESPPKFIRFMPEELVEDGDTPYLIRRSVISFGPRGGEEPENVAKWLHPNNKEAHKQGVFFECTYNLMMDHVSMQTFYSDYGGGVIRITKNRDGKFRLLMRNQQQEFFSESHKNTKTEFSCKFVSWKLDQ